MTWTDRSSADALEWCRSSELLFCSADSSRAARGPNAGSFASGVWTSLRCLLIPASLSSAGCPDALEAGIDCCKLHSLSCYNTRPRTGFGFRYDYPSSYPMRLHGACVQQVCAGLLGRYATCDCPSSSLLRVSDTFAVRQTYE